MLIKCPKCRVKAYTSTMETEWICEYEELYCKCPKCGVSIQYRTIEALKVEE